MQKSKLSLLVVIALAACVVVGIVAYNIGTNSTMKSISESIAKDDEVGIAINRSDLEKPSLVDGSIYVTGHKSPDAGTVCSSIAYARLLNALGYDAQPVVVGRINNETAYILESAGVEAPEQLEDASGCNMVLVDHSEYTHSVEGISDANIITIIDHHNDGAVTTGNQLVYDARPLGATASIVWVRYYNYGVPVDEQTAKLLFGAVLSDTKNLTSNTVTTADRKAVEMLGSLAGVQDPDAYYQDMFKASLSYEGMTDTEIFENDVKTYESAGTRFAITCIEAYDEQAAKDLAARMKAVIPAETTALGVDMAFVQISILHDDISLSYIVPSSDAAAEVVKMSFGDKAQFDGTSYVLNPGVSRKAVLVPAFTDVLAMHPSE